MLCDVASERQSSLLFPRVPKSTVSTQIKGKCQNIQGIKTAASEHHYTSRNVIIFISRIFHLIKRNHPKTGNANTFLNRSPSHASVHFLGHAYLKPLPVGLHLEDDTGVWFGKRISVRNAFACHTQLNFGQAGAVKDSQRIGSWLIDVAHLLHSVLGKKEREKGHSNHHAICQRRKPSNHLSGYCSTNNFKPWMYLLFHFPPQWHSASKTNKQNQRNNEKSQQVLVRLVKKGYFSIRFAYICIVKFLVCEIKLMKSCKL